MINSSDDIADLTTDASVQLIEYETNVPIRGAHAFDMIEALAKRFNIGYSIVHQGTRYHVQFGSESGINRPLPGYYIAPSLGLAARNAFLRWWYQL